MRLLWMINMMVPQISDAVGEKIINYGGWLPSLMHDLIKDMSITVCFPVFRKGKAHLGETKGLTYFSFYQSKQDSIRTIKKQENEMAEIILKSKPDIVHIWGTENRRTLTMVNVCIKMGLSNRVIISMQGIASLISKHYLSGISDRVAKKYTFRDLFRCDNILKQKKNYLRRGEYEVQAIKKVKHIIGRTEWDYAFTIQTNPSIKYYNCNESLRSSESFHETRDYKYFIKYSW